MRALSTCDTIQQICDKAESLFRVEARSKYKYRNEVDKVRKTYDDEARKLREKYEEEVKELREKYEDESRKFNDERTAMAMDKVNLISLLYFVWVFS